MSMDTSVLERHFAKIRARVHVRAESNRWARNPYTLDVQQDRRGEYFDIRLHRPTLFQLLQVVPENRHLLLLADDGERFLCGHDERHLFVAGIQDRVSTVRDAKRSLMPKEVREMIAQMPPDEVDNRRNEIFIRQGEWFFIPTRKVIASTWAVPILHDEPIQRGRSKPHICQDLYREGGDLVYVSGRQVVTEAAYGAWMTDPANAERRLRMSWQQRRINMLVYVRGYVRHPDHATVTLDGWHRVFMNTEKASSQVLFFD